MQGIMFTWIIMNKLLARIIEKITAIIKMIINVLENIINTLVNRDKGSEQSTAEEVVFNGETGATTLWDEFVIATETDDTKTINEDINANMADKIKKQLCDTRGYITQAGKNVKMFINVNITNIPQMNVLRTNANNVNEFVRIGEIATTVCTVNTPIGKVKMMTKHAANIMNLLPKEMYPINPYLVMNKKSNNNISVYGTNYTQMDANVIAKSKTEMIDYYISTKIHFAAQVNITIASRIKSETAIVVVLIPTIDEIVWSGALIEVKKMPFIVFHCVEIKSIKHSMLIASSLVKHNVDFEINLFEGENV